MKSFLISSIFIAMFVTGSARAATLVENLFDTAGIVYSHIDDKERQVYELEGSSAVDMLKVLKVRTNYVDEYPVVVDGQLNMGNSLYDVVAAHHGVSLEYAWDTELQNVGVSFDYTARNNGMTYLSVTVGYRDDMNETGYTEWVYEVFRTNASGHVVITPALIQNIVGNKLFNVIYIQESDIGTSNNGKLDNIIITADNIGEVEYLVLPTVSVQKAGYYTAELQEGYATADIYVNGELVNTFSEGLADVGILAVGDEIRIVADGQEAESIEEIDYQSWNFFYAGDTVKIYVEDPPLPGTVVEEHVCPEPTTVVEYVEVEVPVVIEKVVEVEKIVYVNVPVEADPSEADIKEWYKRMRKQHGKRFFNNFRKNHQKWELECRRDERKNNKRRK